MRKNRAARLLPTVLRWIGCAANITVLFCAVQHGYVLVLVSPSAQTLRFVCGWALLVAGAPVCMTAMLAKDRRLWRLSTLGAWLAISAAMVVACRIWVQRMNTSCEVYPPGRAWQLAGIAVLNLLVLVVNWPVSPLSLLRSRPVLSSVLGGVLLVGILLVGTFFGRLIAIRRGTIRAQQSCLRKFRQSPGRVEWESGWVVALDFSGTRVGNLDLRHLEGFPMLRELELHKTNVTDAGLCFVTEITGLRRLCLEGTGITDNGLEEVGRLANLHILIVSHTHITDRGIGCIRGMRRLQHLDLGGTDVTDACLRYLYDMNGLYTLNVRGTNITEAGRREITSKLPALRVYWVEQD